MSIEAKVICDSISPSGIRLTTLELHYPRFIHAEMLTHRMFSRNASSSRAIPVEKNIQEVLNNPAMPIHWGKNIPGMQAREECNSEINTELLFDDTEQYRYLISNKTAWEFAVGKNANIAKAFSDAGYHKQIVNRLLEPFQHIRVIVTATEYTNFFKLRMHPDAQPEMQELARCMLEAMDGSTPQRLKPGQWHLPYIQDSEFTMSMFVNKQDLYNTAIKCSVARCARVSYLNHDNTSPDINKDIALADKLLAAGHMSPFEHQATPMETTNAWEAPNQDELLNPCTQWEEGVTHMDRNADLWSGNFRGFIQYRQTL